MRNVSLLDMVLLFDESREEPATELEVVSFLELEPEDLHRLAAGEALREKRTSQKKGVDK